jgi:hypothetical protein
METWLFWLDILMKILDLFITEAVPFLVLLWTACAVISNSYEFLRPFIWFKKNY